MGLAHSVIALDGLVVGQTLLAIVDCLLVFFRQVVADGDIQKSSSLEFSAAF